MTSYVNLLKILGFRLDTGDIAIIKEKLWILYLLRGEGGPG